MSSTPGFFPASGSCPGDAPPQDPNGLSACRTLLIRGTRPREHESPYVFMHKPSESLCGADVPHHHRHLTSFNIYRVAPPLFLVKLQHRMAKFLWLVGLALTLCASSVQARQRSVLGVPGGKTTSSVDDPGVQAAASFCIQTLNSDSTKRAAAMGSLKATGQLTLGSVVQATTQVVQGALYDLELCASDDAGTLLIVDCTVWSRPWMKAPDNMLVSDIIVTGGGGSVQPQASPQPAVSAVLPGGWDKYDTSKVKDEAKFCVEQLNKNSAIWNTVLGTDARKPARLLAVEDAKRKVVAGALFNLTLQVMDASSPGRRFVISCNMWTQAWAKVKQGLAPDGITLVYELIPKPVPPHPVMNNTSPTIPGGLQPGNDSSVEGLGAAQACVALLNNNATVRQQTLGTWPQAPFNLVTIEDVQQQVVAGTLYHLQIVITDEQNEEITLKCDVGYQAWQPQPQQYRVLGVQNLGS